MRQHSSIGIGSKLALALLWVCARLGAHQTAQPGGRPMVRTALDSGVDRLAGTEASSQIQYVRLVLKGSLRGVTKGAVDPPAQDPSPMLIGQCSVRPGGRYLFELFGNFGGATDLAFHPPWTPSSSDPFPPRTDKVTMTMDFLGYTHVKPLRRQWEIPIETPGQYRYNPPGGNSSNLEEIAYDLRYLLALPTLRLTLDGRAAEFTVPPGGAKRPPNDAEWNAFVAMFAESSTIKTQYMTCIVGM